MTRTIDALEAALHASAPSDIDIDEMLATVRRRAPVRRRNRVIASVSATVVLTAGAIAVPALLAGRGDVAAPLPAATFTGDCTIEALRLPDSVADMYAQTAVQAFAVDMDPTGRFVLARFTRADGQDDRTPMTVLWDHGVPTALPTIAASAFGEGVNAHGTVVGTMTVGTDQSGIVSRVSSQAFVYENGSLAVLPLPVGYLGASAHAINERGEIAGFVIHEGSQMWQAAVWSAGAGRTPRVLESPGASFATGISSDGTVVGTATVAGPLTDPELERPYVWRPDGVGRFLELPEGYTTGRAHRVRGEWALGGASTLVSTGPYGTVDSVVLWNVRTSAVSIVDGRGGGPNRAVNAHGDVVTFDGVGSTLTRDGRRYPLPHLNHGRSTVGLSAFATAISDDATVILGEHSTDIWDGPTPIVLWHC